MFINIFIEFKLVQKPTQIETNNIQNEKNTQNND